MARRTYKRLTVAAIKQIEAHGKPGLHPDGDGLGLQKTTDGVCSWIFRYQVGPKERRMGLGPLRHVSLKEAREAAAEAHRLRREGIDPLDAKRAQKLAQATAAAKTMTFVEAMRGYVTAQRAGWKNVKHQQQWPLSLEMYALPHFGLVPVAEVDVGLVMKALEPIWEKKPETASRVRQRIEAVLDWATVRGHRKGDNPARWRGHLDKLLPRPSKVRRVVHHAALPYAEVGGFLVELQRHDGIVARALRFLILTAARSGEVRGARWDEIDLADRVWTIPAERMKAGKEHRVPLSEPAVLILEEMAAVRGSSEYVFECPLKDGAPLSTSAFPQFLRAIGHTGFTTTHGFRSTFRDWAGEKTNFPREVCEAALAHTIGNATEAAYARSDLFRRRAQLLEAWGRFVATAPPDTTAKVIAIRA